MLNVSDGFATRSCVRELELEVVGLLGSALDFGKLDVSCPHEVHQHQTGIVHSLWFGPRQRGDKLA